MLKLFFKFIPFVFFLGCTAKVPVTWEKRILHKQVKPLSLVYSEYGNPAHKTLLFLHGFGENRYTWRFLVPALSKKYHLIMVDLKGFGASPKPKDDCYSIYDHAHLISTFIEEKKLKDVTLVGRSFGGGVSLVLALLQEDKLIDKKIEKMILINSMSYKQNLPSMMEVLNYPVIGYLGIHLLSNDYMAREGYRYAFYNDDLIPKESVAITSNYLTFPRAKYAYLKTVNQLVPDDIEVIQKRYKEISLPTLILWGKEDVSIWVEKAHRLHKALKNSTLKIFPNAAHAPQEEIPKLVSHQIIKFMEANQ
jgi:pimeloyl-ACP methyl ester carboxylesterase